MNEQWSKMKNSRVKMSLSKVKAIDPLTFLPDCCPLHFLKATISQVKMLSSYIDLFKKTINGPDTVLWL